MGCESVEEQNLSNEKGLPPNETLNKWRAYGTQCPAGTRELLNPIAFTVKYRPLALPEPSFSSIETESPLLSPTNIARARSSASSTSIGIDKQLDLLRDII